MGFTRSVVLAVVFGLWGCRQASPPQPAIPMSERSQQQPSVAARHFDYPLSPQGATVELLHGVSVADPYRWLEDSSSAQTHSWIAAQNKLTRGYLDALPRRTAIRARLSELWDFE